MKIAALRLFNVKRFAGRGVAIEGIGDGVNVLCAANEYGKSTSFEALHALFFQPHSGTPNPVRNLRPYSGGSPVVEADICTGEGRFRITKQYFGGRSARVTDLATGRLVAQADEAENFIAALIGGGTAGPAGLLWVRQGITGIEKRSNAEEDSEKQVRVSLLESVQGEVEAVTGGRRMAEIMAATAKELAELVTGTGRPKTGGRYADAIETRDGLAAQEQRLAGEVGVLRDALDRRAGAARRLAELDRAEDRLERREATERAQTAFEAARAGGEILKTAEAELNLARERRDVADETLAAFRAASTKAEALRQRREETDQRREEAIARRRDVVEAIGKAQADAVAAEAGERELRGLLSRLDAAAAARAASERLAELTERLGKAEAARQAVEASEADIARGTISLQAIDELQALDVEIAKLRAVEEAARPSVSIAYESDAAAPVTMDGSPLTGGDERGYDGQALLVVPGIGTLTLRSNRQARSDGRLERAEAKRRALLVSLAVDDLAGARARQLRLRELNAALREQRALLSVLAPDGLPKLREEVAARDSVGSEALELKDDPAQVRIALAAAEGHRARMRQVLGEAEPRRAAADEAFIGVETALASLKAEAAQVEAVLGPQEERPRREQSLSGALADFDLRLAEAEAHAARLRAAATDLDFVRAVLDRARSVEAAAETEAGRLREAIAELNGRIRTLADDAVEERWREATEALSAAAARVEGFAREVAVLQRLSLALESARSEARELYLKPVMAELGPLLGLLFDDVSISFDERTLLPQSIRRNGQEEDVERLSGGMREQLSVLTRLAFARLLARDGRPAPVILDDALVYSDDDRIEKMFDALHRQSREQQIIVFSCRQRAFQRLGGNVLGMTDWQP